MKKSVKIGRLVAPSTPLSDFDPGAYLSALEFHETNDEITRADQDGLAQFVHFLAFLALKAKSSGWAASIVKRDTLAFQTLESHFSRCEGWDALASREDGIPYPLLARFLVPVFPPRRPTG